MVVNSIIFLLFFILVFTIYYFPYIRRNVRYQNIWLLIASIFFYGYTDLKVLPILLGSIIVFFFIGKWLKSALIKNNKKLASRITTIGVCIGIGVLLYFKYFNFFADSIIVLLNAIGFHISWSTLNIILPIGVSFFTFKFISYIIEIHRERIDPCKNILDFSVYISFFPTILSGPIDRPGSFLPQLSNNRLFNYDLAMDGFRQIIWGLFTKMCIADILATNTDLIWNNIEVQNGSTLLLIALLYPIQIYADFDGYSNMAIGTGKILGFHITRNFDHPFLARNIAEYWRRWHISLTGWLTDYVFSPLNIAFRNYQNYGIALAIIINFIIIGFWHGASWSFGLFGLYHGLLYIPLIFSGSFGKNKRIKPNSYGLPKLSDLSKMILTFILVSLGLILFRANSISNAYEYISLILSQSLFEMPVITTGKSTYFIIILLFVLEWYQREKEHPLQIKTTITTNKKWLPYVLDFIIIAIIVFYGNFEGNQFIYFQF
jgi:D-alanyl-lipoteichoic acid acyltransferase DltB (MBOAT superfamily)